MKQLTLVTALFLPMTFLTVSFPAATRAPPTLPILTPLQGYFGQNFEHFSALEKGTRCVPAPPPSPTTSPLTDRHLVISGRSLSPSSSQPQYSSCKFISLPTK